MITKKKKERVGIVVSDKMDKTITVRITRRSPHPLYKRIIVSKTKLKAHDEKNIAKVGDTVRISEVRPLSKTKHWNLVKVVDKKVK